mmetsp:Transcript_11029/g.27835  ORF Transcript_11029/g.27835 Transcript_11029/m.27835 type:complete len:242 (+) Transcript_11029:296-1021(+)
MCIVTVCAEPPSGYTPVRESPRSTSCNRSETQMACTWRARRSSATRVTLHESSAESISSSSSTCTGGCALSPSASCAAIESSCCCPPESAVNARHGSPRVRAFTRNSTFAARAHGESPFPSASGRGAAVARATGASSSRAASPPTHSCPKVWESRVLAAASADSNAACRSASSSMSWALSAFACSRAVIQLACACLSAATVLGSSSSEGTLRSRSAEASTVSSCLLSVAASSCSVADCSSY